MANSKLLEIKELNVSFPSESGELEVLGDVSLNIGEGKIVGVVGESGCGKTLTALSVMGLLPVPPARVNSGEVIYKGENLLSLTERELRHYRGNRISMIFQEPMSSLNPVYTVGDQIGEVIRVHENVSRKEEKKKGDRSAGHSRHSISCGEILKLPARNERGNVPEGNDRDGPCVQPGTADSR